ncbi:MAG: PKD domain-containing protein [Bacteroidota bacterium]
MKQHYLNILTKLIALQAFILSGSTYVSGQAPVANFSGAPLTGCSPLVVNFQDLSSGSPTSWNWNFGNGNTSTLQNPTATYFTPGTYTVTLTATNGSGSNTLTRTGYVTVYEAPTVNFSASITSGCFPLPVQFQDLSSPGAGNSNVSWFWDFGNGGTSTLQNPLAIYNSSGAFSVTLRVTNDKGCIRVLSRTNYITVAGGVIASFLNTQPTVCRPPADIAFTNTSTGPPTLSYQWNFGDGNFSTAANPVHTYTASGTYIATLVTFSSAGCQDTAVSNPIVIGGFTTSFTGPPQVCVGETASFTNTSVPAPASTLWNFGDGGTATTTNATHSYATPGIYTVMLYNNYSSCIDSASQPITVNPNPVADFTAPVTSRCEPPLTVNFQDLTTGGAVSWQWDFGDGGTSTLQNPSHTYTSYGSFDVTLIVTTGSGCTDTLVQPDFIVIRRAIISIPGLPARGCIPYTFNFNPVISSVDVITSYNWDFGDGGTSTLPNPSHTYTVQGTYDVTLTITTSSGCTDDTTIINAVRVGSNPVADFSAAPLITCANEPVQFTDLSAPADEWLWDFGDGGSSILPNPTHSYGDTGYFTVRLIAYNNGCPDTMTKTNYIYVLPPVADFTITPDCSNRLRFTFTDQSILPLTWSWDFGDASTSTIQNPVHIYPSLGTYNVRLIVTNGGCADTLIQVVNAVDENPDFFADILTACRVATIPFHATGINTANIANYFWDFGDGGTASVSVPDVSHTYTNSGTYTVTLTTTDINGCTDSRTLTNYIRINGPVADFTATNVAGCAGMTTTFNDLSTGDGVNAIINWQFDFGDGNTQNFSGPPFQHTYSSIGTFSVKLIVTDAAGCKDSLTLINLVTTTDLIPNFTAPVVLSCPGAIVSFNNTSAPPGFTSLWDFGDGGTSTVASPNHVYAAAGLYTVKLRIQDANGCADSLTRIDYIRVDAPVAGFTLSDSISSCTPFEVQMTNTSTYYYDSFWDFGPGEGTSTVTHPVHFYSTPGIYPVKLVVVSPGGCRDSITKTVYVYDTAGTVMNYLPLGGCKPLTANFSTFSPGPMVSYLWDFGDGNTITTATPNVNHIYNSFGNFLPRLIMEDPSGCIIPVQGFDTVFVVGATAKFGYDDTLFCDSGAVSFTDSTTFNDPITLYSWTFGDGGSSAQQNPVYQYNNPGLYTVQLQVETQAGCRDTMTKTNLVAIVQRPLIDITGDTALCIYRSGTHSGQFIQPDTSVVTWSWSFPNGNNYSVQNPPVQTYNTAGSFTITAIATNSTGCKDTTYHNLTVNPLPTVNIPAQMTIQNGFPVQIPAVYSPNTVNWIWSPATGLSCVNCPTPDADPKFKTLYQVYFTDVNGCSNTGSILVFVICKNANLFIPNTFSPNGDGSNDVFYPRGQGLERVKLLRIFNRWGEVVFEKRDVPVNDPFAGWNGTFRGRQPMADVYIYQAEVFCENGEIIKLNGNIALIL